MPIAIERLLGRTGTVLQAQGYALAVILAAATIAIVLAVDATGDLGRRAGRDVFPWRRGSRARGR
jgi:thiamine transport system permease protein